MLMEAYHRIRRWWTWALLSPLLYLLLAYVVIQLGWFNLEEKIHNPIDAGVTHWIIGTTGLVLLGVIIYLRLTWATQVRQQADPAQSLSRWQRIFFIITTLSDTIAFLGLIDFCITGRLLALLAAGVGAYLGYAMAYPAQGPLRKIFHQPI